MRTYLLDNVGSRRKRTKQALPRLLTRLRTRQLWAGGSDAASAAPSLTLGAQLDTVINVLRPKRELRCPLVIGARKLASNL